MSYSSGKSFVGGHDGCPAVWRLVPVRRNLKEVQPCDTRGFYLPLRKRQPSGRSGVCCAGIRGRQVLDCFTRRARQRCLGRSDYASYRYVQGDGHPDLVGYHQVATPSYTGNRVGDARNTALLPLFIESVTLSKGLEYYLKNRQWIDASSPPLERHMPSLIRAVRELLTGEVTPLPPHQEVFQPSQRKSRRWLIIGTVVPLIVAFAILTYKGCSRAGRENGVNRQSTINGQEEARNSNVQASRPSCKDYGVTIAQHTQKVADPRQPVLLTGTVNPLPPGLSTLGCRSRCV